MIPLTIGTILKKMNRNKRFRVNATSKVLKKPSIIIITVNEVILENRVLAYLMIINRTQN